MVYTALNALILSPPSFMSATLQEGVLRDLLLPDELIACGSGAIRSPMVTFTSPAHWYGYPPALIPLWGDPGGLYGPSYLGVWKHWFCDRALTFVRFHVWADPLAIEVARTPEQFLSIAAIRSIFAHDGVTQDLTEFAARVGLSDLAEIDLVCVREGDDPLAFREIECFRQETPLESVEDSSNYDGDFPINDFSLGTNWLQKACRCELSEANQAVVDSMENVPPWLDAEQDKPTLFSELVRAGDLAGAWLTLNSTGWKIREARDAIQLLDRHAESPEFSNLANAWLDVADPAVGGY